MDRQEWLPAARAVGKARSWQVSYPPVMRAYADLLILQRSDDLS